MSFGLSRGRELEAAPVGVTDAELGPLPDEIVRDPLSARVDPRTWFEHSDRPFEIEIGSGKGTFLLHAAGVQPERNFLGIEWAREFWLYTSDRCRRAQVRNIRTLNTDASEFLHWRVPDGVVEVIHLYFPDPWPKSRHHRRRIVQDRFLEDCHRVLSGAGELRVVTDHEGYWAWMQEHFLRVRGRLFDAETLRRPEGVPEGELVGTNFERKYRREGRPFHSVTLRKRAL
ncbi:MAG: tRNA (guanosine(46)-N7)-methyltransferase TrmB [Phycisphaerales bacterium]